MVDASSTVWDIYESVGYPAPNEDDLAAWEHLDCGDADLCGTYDETGYFNVQSGMFGWADWEDFVDDCDTATTSCSDLYTTDDYDGWAVGVYLYNDSLSTLLADDEKFGVVFVEDEFCWYVYMDSTTGPDVDLGWNDVSGGSTIGEDYPAVDDLDSHDSNDSDAYGFGSWYTYWSGYTGFSSDEFEDTIFWF